MRVFQWFSHEDAIPARHDLRRLGWTLNEEPGDTGAIQLIDFHSPAAVGRLRPATSAAPTSLQRMMFTNVDRPSDRAQLLRGGAGDAVPGEIDLLELESRALRVLEHARSLPRTRDLGRLRLDLLTRAAYVDNRPIDVGSREFAMLWRLSDTPDHAVPRDSMVQDVWRLNHVEANNVAVHLSRLRNKLATAGLRDAVETLQGAYCLRVSALSL